MTHWQKFRTWGALLVHLSNGAQWIWYHAPLDVRPRLVKVVRIYKNGKVRINPGHPDCDPFTADSGHLDRFMVMS